MICLKRIYEGYDTGDGFRILTDRLWPRGIKKESAHIDLWMKEIAPSTELRKWFNHDPAKWTMFKKRYKQELIHSDSLTELKKISKAKKKITLLYAAREEAYVHTRLLMELLEG